MPEMPKEPNVENNNNEGGAYYPYIPFQTFTGLLDRLKTNGVPNRIDRSYLSYTSGSIQTYLLRTLQGFELIDEAGRPTPSLTALVEADETDRRGHIRSIVSRHYAEALALGTGATPAELAEVFREKYDLGGDTARKGITFFLNAASYAGIEVSPHYKLPRATTRSGGASRKPAMRRKQTSRREVDPDVSNSNRDSSLDTAKARYLDMLMKKAETQDEMDEGLLDRIEALLGYEAPRSERED
jgi:hypothetical protein